MSDARNTRGRVGRWVLAVLSIASFILAILTVVVWVRSYWIRDTYEKINARVDGDTFLEDSHSARFDRGKIWFGTYHHRNFFLGYPDVAKRHLLEVTSSASANGWSSDGVDDYQFPFPGRTQSRLLGFGWSKLDDEQKMTGFVYHQSSTHEHMLGIPLWAPLVFFLILPALTFPRTMRRRLRNRRGLCPICGYDLRASPERCPECGARSTIG